MWSLGLHYPCLCLSLLVISTCPTNLVQPRMEIKVHAVSMEVQIHERSTLAVGCGKGTVISFLGL